MCLANQKREIIDTITQGDSCIIVFIQIGPDVLDFGDIFDEDVRLIL